MAFGNTTNITLTIDGFVSASSDYKHWPFSDGVHYDDLFHFSDMKNFTIKGNG